MRFSGFDERRIIDRYTTRYEKYGYDPRSLGWERENQEVRFEVLTSQYKLSNRNILDIGCGFGDLNNYLKNKESDYRYFGIDLVEPFIEEAKKLQTEENVQFKKANILEFHPKELFDYAIASGIFNYQLSDGLNYEYIEEVMHKTLDITKDGLAFDFLSDKVDFKDNKLFYNNSEKILNLALRFSRNIVLRSDYMPFEFSIFIFKDQSYNKKKLYFNNFNKTQI
jgi:SAM-dependent methyltransferase